MADYQRVCEELGRVKAELDYLRGENAEEVRQTRLADIRRAFRLTPAACVVLLTLYDRAPRVISHDALEEALPRALWHERESGTKTVDVRICLIRRVLGKHAVETVWGVGYRIGLPGITAVESVLGDKAVRVAA